MPHLTRLVLVPAILTVAACDDDPSRSGPDNSPPTADFTVACDELTCTMLNSSSDGDGTIQAHAWDFGDGTTSTEQHPTHSYAAPGGEFTVALTVTDDQGDAGTETRQVRVPNAAPVAAFAASCALFSCSFTDQSTDPDGGPVALRRWEFGDGGTSTDQHPTHVYATPGGEFAVRLTVTDERGATRSLSRTVRAANAAQIADFAVSCTGLTCEFTDLSIDRDEASGDAIVTRTWYFYDDDSSSGAPDPVHTFPAPGYEYRVALVVTDRYGASTTRQKLVDVRQSDVPPPPDPEVAGTVRVSMAATGSEVPASFWGAVSCVVGCAEEETYVGRYPVTASGVTNLTLPAGEYRVVLTASDLTCAQVVEQFVVTAGGTSEVAAAPFCERALLQVALRITGQSPPEGFLLLYWFCQNDCAADVIMSGFEPLAADGQLSLRAWRWPSESGSVARLELLTADSRESCEVASMIVQSEHGPPRDFFAQQGSAYEVEVEVTCGG